ncbi:DDE-type integrase/transposase/recombinase [Dactylosporangium fulvum]|uniref:DDE-type integrase/transposase/recombinase n=1 Tax=Dactylosporangium fulvum TaxID=53359 RepID=UPI00387373AE
MRGRRGGRWYVDETSVKVGGVWRYVYRAVDQYGDLSPHDLRRPPPQRWWRAPLGAATSACSVRDQTSKM